jgi:CubicO group peptidase (beta-lactamase class C family)
MKRTALTLASAMLLTSLAALTPIAQQAQNPSDGPAARRVQELARVISVGSRAEAKKYATENYGPEFLKMPMDNHLGFISRLHDLTRGLEFHSFQEVKPTEATALFKSKLTGSWVALLVRVEAEAPHRITGIGQRQPKPPAGEASTKPLGDAEKARELDAFVKKLADADVFSGAVLLARDGRVIYKKAFGEANKDFNAPNRADTKFNLGSMNKMFTAVAIAQLVERGKLSFDDPLSKFLPDFPTKEAAEKIKIKHLLTHTSGLGKDEKLQFEPGTKWSYSNTGMLVLGAVVEKVTGQSYYDYVRENIAKPAGMVNTDCYELDYVNPNLAVGYEKEYTDAGVRFSNNIFKHVMRGGPAGGGYSTVEDLLRFDAALRAGKLVSAEMVKTLLAPKPEVNSPRYGYGFGLDPEKQIYGHSGGFPGISSNLDMFWSNGYTAVVMSNYGGGAFPVTEKMRELVLAGQESRAANR